MSEPRLAHQIAGFLLVGATNTAFSLLLYLVLLLAVPYWVAYTLSFAAGLAFSLFANATFAFRRSVTVTSGTKFAAVYLVSYAAGLAIVIALVEGLRVPPALAPFVAVAVMLPVNFLGSRWALGRRL